ncbi:hypothetical protein B4135_3870 [Caldibacillus debilis]|uniref:Uncharacterized protein n=1 Tax=Caldibacillus debilis TaxID=301148 RepID=A0A150LAC1_9BACI|nr:hypothetical protein B4135_3870 [Caldibacillus debilis]
MPSCLFRPLPGQAGNGPILPEDPQKGNDEKRLRNGTGLTPGSSHPFKYHPSSPAPAPENPFRFFYPASIGFSLKALRRSAADLG